MAENVLKFQITADGAKAISQIKGVESALNKLGSGGAVSGLQKDFKAAASEASNLVGIFTGNRLSGITSQITSFAGAVGAIPGPVGAAIGGIAGLATTAVAASAALVELIKKGSDLGRAF